jgi:hypothetical protein
VLERFLHYICLVAVAFRILVVVYEELRQVRHESEFGKEGRAHLALEPTNSRERSTQ